MPCHRHREIPLRAAHLPCGFAHRPRRAARTCARSWRCAPQAGRRSPWRSRHRGRSAPLHRSSNCSGCCDCKPSQSRARAPPDLFDHSAVVQVSLPLPHAGFQHRGMDFEQRKLLLHPFGLREHEAHILEMLGEAAFGGKFAADHLRTFDVHDLRIGGRAARDLEKSLRLESKSLGKYQTLSHGQSVEARIRLMASLARPPSPILPIWKWVANSARKTGSTADATCASPPISATPSPRLTWPLAPETGVSRRRSPRVATRLSNAAMRSVSQVLAHRMILPERSPNAGNNSLSIAAST